jgi:hypothetical protein
MTFQIRGAPNCEQSESTSAAAPGWCLREPICSVGVQKIAKSSYFAESMIDGFRFFKAKHQYARPLHSDKALRTALRT